MTRRRQRPFCLRMKFDLVQLQQKMTAVMMFFLTTTTTNTVSSFTTFWTPVNNNINNDSTANNPLRRHHRRFSPCYSSGVQHCWQERNHLMRQNRRPCHRIFFLSGTRNAYHNNARNAKGRRTLLRLAATTSSTPEDTEQLAVPASPPPPATSLYIHHTAIKTSNITTAIQFYSLFGFTVTCKFRAGPARAAWLELNNNNSSNEVEGSDSGGGSARLELIEVPSYMLNQSKRPQRAINLMERQELLGHNHLCLDVTSQIAAAAAAAAMSNSNTTDGARKNVTAIDDDVVDDHETTQSKPTSLSGWLQKLNEASLDEFGKTLRVALQPRQQLIGRSVYELAFLYDADGSLVELLNLQSQLKQNIESGWEPLQWDVNATDFLSSEGLQQ